MKRPFRSFRVSSTAACDPIEPLLPLYTDGMASPAEVRAVEAHLPGCADCRAALAWMQATRLALANRPVAVPPPDLHSRIALAIASSSAAPVARRPARVFALSRVYAAAATLTALGIALTYPHWHTPGEIPVNHPVKQTVIANMPGSIEKTSALPKVAKHLQVASRSNKPIAVKPGIIARKMPLRATPPLEHVAAAVIPAKVPAVPQAVKAPVRHEAPAAKIASRGTVPAEKHSTEKHLPLPTLRSVTPKLTEAPLVAKVTKEPLPIHLEMPAPKLVPDPLPAVQMASAAPGNSSDGLSGELSASVKRMHTASYVATRFTKRLSSRGASDMMHTLGGEEHSAFIPGVYSP